jgi:ribokinase
MQLETSLREVARLAARARIAGARVVLNAAPAMPLSAALLSNVDLLVVNEHEATVCAGALSLASEHHAFVAGMNERFGVTAVLTLGAAGAMTRIDRAPLHVNAPAVKAVDTTGAGDAFAGALAAALDRGASIADAVVEGVNAGARACTHAGAQRVP